MIIFHEGLPGSGKSYEVFKSHIVPRLKEGRSALVYVEGVNHAQIAGLAEITEEQCRAQLRTMTREEVPLFYKLVKKDDLVVLDEAQNFWPSQRQPLDKDTTQFVTEHRHLGVDVILMGQVVGDVHSLWRGRIDRKMVFNKLDAIGMPTAYKWIAYKRIPGNNGREKWDKLTAGESKYDPSFFGCYASHEPGVEQKGTYRDDRFNLFKSRYFRLALPMAVVVAVFGLWYAYGYLHGDHNSMLAKAKNHDLAKTAQTVIESPIQQAQGTTQKASPISTPENGDPQRYNQSDVPADMVERLSKVFRLRLIGTYSSNGGVSNGLIEWRAADNALVNKLTFREIESMGYTVFTNREASIAYITRGRVNVMAVSWSLKDDVERVSQDNRLQASPATQSAPPQSAPSIGLGEPFPPHPEPRFVDAESLHRG